MPDFYYRDTEDFTWVDTTDWQWVVLLSVETQTLPVQVVSLIQPSPLIIIDVISATISQGISLSLNTPTINITDDIRILVTNTRNFAISEYSNFAFNSMCLFNGRYLYARSDGIYEGSGDDDNGTPIQASYKTGAIDTYTTEIQRLRDAYLLFESDGRIQLFSVGDEENTRHYNITASTMEDERRVKFERGIKDRHFNFGISNIDGSTLEVDSVKILTEPLRKRR